MTSQHLGEIMQLSVEKSQQPIRGCDRRYSDHYQCTNSAHVILQVTQVVGLFLDRYHCMYKPMIAPHTAEPLWLRKFFIDKQTPRNGYAQADTSGYCQIT